MTTERRVRVACPECGDRGPVVVESRLLGDYPECRGTTCDGSGTILATLSDPEAEALMADGEKAIAFVREIFGGEYERGDWDGGDLQDLGIKTGVLREVQMTAPCGEECTCAEFYDEGPWNCYVLDLTPTPETRDE